MSIAALEWVELVPLSLYVKVYVNLLVKIKLISWALYALCAATGKKVFFD